MIYGKRFFYHQGYDKGTIKDKRTIGTDSLYNLHVWVDPSYTEHDNMCGYTGGTKSMGRSTLHNKSSKQMFNTQSSTESELVGDSKYLPYDLWYAIFFIIKDMIKEL